MADGASNRRQTPARVSRDSRTTERLSICRSIVGVRVLRVHLIFATALDLLPPRPQ